MTLISHHRACLDTPQPGSDSSPPDAQRQTTVSIATATVAAIVVFAAAVIALRGWRKHRAAVRLRNAPHDFVAELYALQGTVASDGEKVKVRAVRATWPAPL